MKTYLGLFAALFALTLVVVGCGKQSTVNTAPLEQSFKSAEPATQTTADKAVAAIKAGDYAGALTELKTLAGNAKLTPEQQQAIKDVTDQVQKAVAQVAEKAKDQATKTVDDVKKSLTK